MSTFSTTPVVLTIYTTPDIKTTMDSEAKSSETSRFVRCLTSGCAGTTKHFPSACLATGCEGKKPVYAAAIYEVLAADTSIERAVRAPFKLQRSVKRSLEGIKTRERTSTSDVEGLCIVWYKLAVPMRRMLTKTTVPHHALVSRIIGMLRYSLAIVIVLHRVLLFSATGINTWCLVSARDSSTFQLNLGEAVDQSIEHALQVDSFGSGQLPSETIWFMWCT
ncbi:hypothetical protein GQ600_19187 [Phytophthora cactorum]|nr:hypothetical protein GQ600_19187 [Phytophthora cactorum]